MYDLSCKLENDHSCFFSDLISYYPRLFLTDGLLNYNILIKGEKNEN